MKIYSRAALVLVPIAIAVGCGKKTPEPPVYPTSVADTTQYTIKKGTRAVGMKFSVSTEKTTRTTAADDHEEKVHLIRKKADFIETIQEMKDGSVTKRTRAYRSASTETDGESTHASYSGKLVTIEKRDDLFIFTVDGKRPAASETADLNEEFGKADGGGGKDLLPKSPVRIGEEWSDIKEDLQKGWRSIPGVDLDKCKATMRLTKVYSSDGARWGVIETKGEIVFGSKRPENTPEKYDLLMTLDVPIDGSTPEGTMSMRIAAKYEYKGLRGATATGSFEINETEKHTLVK